MQKLHLVGFTPDLDGLILSTRKGAKSGSFLVSIDPGVLKQLVETRAPAQPAAARTNGAAPKNPRQSRPESQLGPREMQELLRGGWTLEEVAVEAGVDVDWVSRFAAPVLAEMRLVLEQAHAAVFDRPRVGRSALPLAASVRRNVAERGVRFTDEEFDDCWRAHQLDDVVWVVGFDYQSRGKRQSAEWTIDLETGELMSRGRLGTQLGHVQSARRRVDTTPLPKPKPKAAAARAVQAAPVQAPQSARSRKAAPSKKTSAPVQRPRARQSGRTSAPTKKVAQPRKAAKPHAADPWREELRRRELERSHVPTTRAPQEARPAPSPPLPVAPVARPAPPRREERDSDLRPVAIIGPTVRTLARRTPAETRPPDPPTMEPTIDPTPAPVVSDGRPDPRWMPKVRRTGPLPAPKPLPVPAEVRERVATPLGQVEDDDVELPAATRSVPVRPVFKGAQAAAGAEPPRRRRSEPLRGR